MLSFRCAGRFVISPPPAQRYRKARTSMKRHLLLTVLGLGITYSLASALHGAPSDAAAAQQAKDILTQSRVKGGFVVHVGSGDGNLTASLKGSDSYQVHGLDTSAEK